MIRYRNIICYCIHTECEAHVFSEKCKIDDPRLCGSCQTHFLSLTPEIVNNKDKGILPLNPCYDKFEKDFFDKRTRIIYFFF